MIVFEYIYSTITGTYCSAYISLQRRTLSLYTKGAVVYLFKHLLVPSVLGRNLFHIFRLMLS